MKITLIYLPHPYLKQPDAQVPLGILYLKSILDRSYIGVSTKVKNYSSYTFQEAIDDLDCADAYGITITSLELPFANKFAKAIKNKYKDCKIVLGGAGIDIYNDFIRYVNYNFVDSCVIGEAENAILKVVKDYLDNKQLELYYKCNPVGDLDIISFPDRFCLGDNQGGNIFAYNKNYKGSKSTTILTSRGCPHHCSFCSSPKFDNVKPVRFRSPKNVHEEIKEVKEKLNINQFRISDDMFLSRPIDELQELCNLIKDLDIVWRISTRVKPFDTKIAKLLKNSGCVEVSFGIESFDDYVLNGLNKRATAQDNAKALVIAHDEGLITRVLFMIRTPFQRSETIELNIQYLEQFPYDIIACTSFVPLPGSDIWRHPDKYNIEILTRDLNKYNFYFWNSEGENKLYDIIKIKDRSLEELNKETQEFKLYLKSTGKLNMG